MALSQDAGSGGKGGGSGELRRGGVLGREELPGSREGRNAGGVGDQGPGGAAGSLHHAEVSSRCADESRPAERLRSGLLTPRMIADLPKPLPNPRPAADSGLRRFHSSRSFLFPCEEEPVRLSVFPPPGHGCRNCRLPNLSGKPHSRRSPSGSAAQLLPPAQPLQPAEPLRRRGRCCVGTDLARAEAGRARSSPALPPSQSKDLASSLGGYGVYYWGDSYFGLFKCLFERDWPAELLDPSVTLRGAALGHPTPLLWIPLPSSAAIS